jgi:hypothetical protein
MVKRGLAAAAIAASVLGVGGAASAAPKPLPTTARVVGVVRIDQADPTVGYVTATYRCYGEGELWVSAKQTAARDRDPALTEEGSSAISAAWSMSHRNPVTCDGKMHVQTFVVDQVETGMFGIPLSPLERGYSYVQFCLFDDNYPAVGDDPATLMPFSDMTFHRTI